jgi:protein SCO1/2
MISTTARAWMAVLLAGAATACSNAGTARQYELQGQILAIRPDTAEVVIKHGDIKGFMPGMTMPFKVRDRALLEGKTAGDLVTAQLTVQTETAWISRLDKTGSAPLAEVVAPSPSLTVPLAPGDPLPAASLTDQDGRTFSIRSLDGVPVVVTFVYTRCPLPQFCPLMDRRFAEIQQGILATPELRGRARLLTVSFDPDFDSPAVLKAHALKVGADPEVWTFATAPRAEVDAFAAALGVSVMREADRTITHNLRTGVFDAGGRAVAIYSGSEWSAAQVLADLRRGLRRS